MGQRCRRSSRERLKHARYLLERWRLEKPLHRVTLLALFTLGFLLRFAYLFQPMVHDESSTYVYFTSQPLARGLSYYPYPNNHLLNTLFTHISTGLFGNNPWAVRLPAFIGGLLVMPVAYLLSRRIFDRAAAVITLALVATSSHLIFYSTSARVYSIQAVIFLLLVWVGLDLLSAPSRRSWAAFVVLSSLGFYAVPTMLFMFLALAVWLALSAWRFSEKGGTRPFLIRLAVACSLTGLAVVLLYLPVLLRPDTGLKGVGAHRVGSWSAFPGRLAASIFSLWKTWSGDLPAWVAVALLLGFLLCLIFYRRIVAGGEVDLFLVLPACFLLVTVPLRILTLRRSWLPVLPLYYAWCAAGVLFSLREAFARLPGGIRAEKDFLRNALEPVALISALLVAAAVLFSGSPQQPADQLPLPEAEELAVCLKNIVQPGDLVYLEPNVRKSLEYYALREGLPLEYFYGYGGKKGRPAPGGRIILIDVRQKRFRLEKTLRCSGLPLRRSQIGRPFAWFGRTRVYLIRDGRLSGPHAARSGPIETSRRGGWVVLHAGIMIQIAARVRPWGAFR